MSGQELQNGPTPGARVVMGLIRGYQIALSPFMGGSCRFHPSCSRYGMEAVAEHGAVRGSWMAAKRVGRCHPWREGGYDPVPLLDDSRRTSDEPEADES